MSLYRNIVIDIDETLVKSFTDIESNKIFKESVIYPLVIDRVYYIYNRSSPDDMILWGITRKHVKEFLEYVFKNFDLVIIWSAGIPQYVKVIVNYLFEGLPYPDYVLDQTYCKVDPCSDMWYKPLTELRNLNHNISLRNTIIVDDNRYNFIANISNGILIPPFNFDPRRPNTFPDKDDTLRRLMKWFDTNEFKSVEDVRLLDKSTIFSPISTRMTICSCMT
jgi:TFIIF-interacting CTD phosphatase-like protein